GTRLARVRPRSRVGARRCRCGRTHPRALPAAGRDDPRRGARLRASPARRGTPGVSGAALDTHTIAAARLWATARLPYLANALFACAVRPDPGSGTIGIDRSWQVRADPATVSRLTVEQLGRLLVHLTGHVIRDHASRAEQLG